MQGAEAASAAWASAAWWLMLIAVSLACLVLVRKALVEKGLDGPHVTGNTHGMRRDVLQLGLHPAGRIGYRSAKPDVSDPEGAA